jgi:hypothetical protein
MADIWFDVDAALSEVPVNIFPLTDDTDFKTRKTAVAYNATGMDLVWNFVTTAGAMSQTAVTPTTGGAYDWTHQGDGMYTIEIPASGGASINNDTEGFGWFTGICTGVLPWRSPVFGFRAAALNNALIDGGDLLDVNVTHISDTAQTGRDIGASVLLSSGTGTGQISLSSGAVTAGTVSDKTGYTASTVSDKTGYSLSVAPPSASDIATAVWGAGTRTLSSFGTLVADIATAVWGAVARTITGGTITTNSDKTGYTVSTVSDKTGYSLTVTPPTAEQIRSEIDSNSTRLADINGATDKLDTAMELDGAVYRFTTNALEEAPSSSGGDATAANQTTIINAIGALNDISTSDVLTQAASALNTYDPPTKAELDIAIAAVAGLTGSYARVITVQDGLGKNVIAANVEVWDSANTVFYQRLQTSSSGQVTFNMDAGTYTIRIYRAGYTFADATLTISGAGSTTYNMTPFTTPTASNVNMCRVYGYFMTPEGGYYTTLTPSAVVEETYDFSNNFYKGDVTGGYVAGTGLVYWDIVRGAKARVRIPEIGYEAEITVPDASSSKLDDLV